MDILEELKKLQKSWYDWEATKLDYQCYDEIYIHGMEMGYMKAADALDSVIEQLMPNND